MDCRVFVDAPLYRSPALGGVNRFVAEITAALTRANGFETLFYARDLNQISANEVRRRLYFKGGGYLPWIERLTRSAALARWQADLYFNTYYAWQPYVRVPTVCVVYDLIHERFPEQFSRAGRFIARKRHCFGRAEHLLCDSEATKRDLLEFYPFVDPQAVDVTYLGVDTTFFQPTRDGSSLKAVRSRIGDARYWLYVGRREFPYKNFAGLLRGFGQSQSASTHKLVVIGSQADPSAAEQELLNSLGLQDSVVFLGRVPDSVLREAYTQAEALVYPSLYEGFGLPLLEAMACGTVVLSSNAASLPEAGGNVPLYFAPDDLAAMAGTMDRAVAMGESERARRIQRGLQRAEYFSWERCAEQVVELFRRIVSDRCL